MRLLHPPVEPWLVRTAEGCRVSLLIADAAAPPPAVYLRADPNNEERLIAMQAAATHAGATRYEALLPWDPGNTTTYYAFKIVGADRQHWLAADGTHAHIPAHELMFRVCRDHQPPSWIADQIAYQIFPDRFCQGDPSHAVQTDEYVYAGGRWRITREAWNAPINPELGPSTFYGGDLIGIRHQLDYLRDELGITLLYLNPIFTSGSNHKYDTEDYANVDPHLGGNPALAELSAAVHARGMRLILDAVVNHTGSEHPWFDRAGRRATNGAYQSTESPWRRWYMFRDDHAGGYVSWKGHQTLPVLDFGNPEVCAEVYAGPNAILRRWMRPPYAIDGWRFDVIHMLGEGPGAHNNHRHVHAMRSALRDENAEAYMLGEHFGEATRWLQGDQEDGAMNYYGFAIPVRAWLAGKDIVGHPVALSTIAFERWLADARARIPYANQLAQLNLLDSHDTTRFLTAAGDDISALMLAVSLLFTYPGVPCVYYGDEIGLAGGRDPDCRRCFDWDRSHWHAALHAHYRQLIAHRHARAELRRGAYLTIAVGDDAFAFARFTPQAITLVAVNRGATPVELDISADTLPPLGAIRWQTADGTLARLELAPRSSQLVFGDVAPSLE